MNFKSLGFKAAIATAVVASSAVAIAPAEAASIQNKTLSFSGASVLLQNDGPVGSTSIFNFAENIAGDNNNYSTNTGTGQLAFNSNPAFGTGSFIFKDLRLTKTSAITWSLLGAVGDPNGTVTKFISGLSSGITYSLKSFNLNEQIDGSFKAVLHGFFSPGKIGDKNSSITSQESLTDIIFANGKDGILDDTSGSSFSGNITATIPVPTPALLPGLLGLGVSALRKRKSEESDVEAAETVKA